MALRKLSHDQQVALVALIEAVAMANGMVSEDEVRGIGTIVDELGEDNYRTLLEEADERFPDIKALKRFLVGVTDQEVREEMFGIVWDEAVVDPDISHTETELLDWLRETWDIEGGESSDDEDDDFEDDDGDEDKDLE